MSHFIATNNSVQASSKAPASNPTMDFDIIDDTDQNTPITKRKNGSWKILIIDDEDEIHQSTKFALKGIKILDKTIDTYHAYSAAEGLEKIRATPNLALILLDVVMESADAGLRLVDPIRNLGYTEVRIILRTGQPGYAPELTVMSEYDINDYRTKSELTRTRLISCLTTAFRSYQQIHIINSSRHGLELIINSAKDIFKRRNIDMFARGVLTQLIALRGEPADGIVFLLSDSGEQNLSTENLLGSMEVITTTRKFEKFANSSLADMQQDEVYQAIFRAYFSKQGIDLEHGLGLHFSSSEGKQLFIYVDEFSDCDSQHATLLKVFAGNIAIAFENLALIERLDELAYIDPILKIPNTNALSQQIETLGETNQPLSLITVHINQIEHAIVVFGHAIVNQALVDLREKFITELTPSPFCVASDGKEDLFLLVSATYNYSQTIKNILDQKICVDGITLSFSAIISIADVEEDMDSQTVVRNSISALILAATQSGTNNVVKYDAKINSALNKRILMQSSLREALEFNGGVQAYLQPKVNCADGKLVGAEALCRWELNGNAIAPDEFVPIAEAGGLSSKLTDAMLIQIASFAESRRAHNLPILPVAVNLSMNELHLPNFADSMHNHLLSLGLSPKTIEFEITENVMMLDPDKTIYELSRLRELGYYLAIDDFGTGYSSLNYLHRLPVNCLKIDKIFINQLDINSAKSSLAATSISIAEKLGLTVIAEGIETQEQHDALKFLGCNVCQGYLFGKPVAAENFNRTHSIRQT